MTSFIDDFVSDCDIEYVITFHKDNWALFNYCGPVVYYPKAGFIPIRLITPGHPLIEDSQPPYFPVAT